MGSSQGNDVYAFNPKWALIECSLWTRHSAQHQTKRGLQAHCGILDVEVKPDCFLCQPFLTSSLPAIGESVSVAQRGRALGGPTKEAKEAIARFRTYFPP